MPFKSQAQRRKFYELAKQGKISMKVVREYESATKIHKLPERLHPKKQSK